MRQPTELCHTQRNKRNSIHVQIQLPYLHTILNVQNHFFDIMSLFRAKHFHLSCILKKEQHARLAPATSRIGEKFSIQSQIPKSSLQRTCFHKAHSFVFVCVSVCCCVCFVLQITFGKQQDNKFRRRNPLSLSLLSLLANTLSVGACVWCLHNTRVIARKGIRTAELLSPQIIARRPAEFARTQH
jgi:hypothetical protein